MAIVQKEVKTVVTVDWAALSAAIELRVMDKLQEDLKHWADDVGMRSMFLGDACDGLKVCELLLEGNWQTVEKKLWDMDTAARDYLWDFLEAELGVDELEIIRANNG
jgi:hypothetical protein